MRPSVMSLCSLAAAGALLVALAAGCSSGSSTLPRPGATATSTPSPAPLLASATASIAVGTSAASASLGPVLGGYSSTVAVPAASNAASLTLTLGATQPAGTPAVQTVKRRTQAIGGTGVTPVAFLTVQSTVAVTLVATTVFSFTLPAGAPALGQISGIALHDPTASPQSGWTTFDGPGTVSGNTLAFSGSSTLQLNAGVTYDVVLFTTVSALPTPTPVPTAPPAPTPTATPTPSASEGVITEFPSSTVGRYPYSADRAGRKFRDDPLRCRRRWCSCRCRCGRRSRNGRRCRQRADRGEEHDVVGHAGIELQRARPAECERIPAHRPRPIERRPTGLRARRRIVQRNAADLPQGRCARRQRTRKDGRRDERHGHGRLDRQERHWRDSRTTDRLRSALHRLHRGGSRGLRGTERERERRRVRRGRHGDRAAVAAQHRTQRRARRGRADRDARRCRREQWCGRRRRGRRRSGPR